MTELRYRIQVGNKYTYRDTHYKMDRLVKELIDGDSIQDLLAQVRGIKTEQKPVKPEEISIAVEIAPPKSEEQWHDLPVRAPKKERPKRPKLTAEARKEWQEQFKGRKAGLAGDRGRKKAK